MRNRKVIFLLFNMLVTVVSFSQVVQVDIGVRDSIQSDILGEQRPIIITLPATYHSGTTSYPVLYVLDGNETGVLNAIVVTRKLRQEMIIVSIPNVDRDRDMMPLSTPTYSVEYPGAAQFLSFIEKELIPHIEKKWRTNNQRTLRGASLSGLFVMFTFLEKPELFDNYIGNSAGWYDDMNPFFNDLIEKAFEHKERFFGKKLFVANSLVDSYDPNREVHKAMLAFAEKVNSELGNKIFFKYQTYENYGHVPFPSFFDGLEFVLNSD